ncbi:MAG: hypothetical protein OS130_10010 [Thermodesulfobacteriota bacterium]|nr:MAG: hypothetical protein OS130_10010 [Thermodesulfobacteriota bacterium]
MDGKFVEIFKTGRHTDSGGNTKTWTEDDLDGIVQKYNPAEHEAPIVIGHPKENAPAWAWVEELKREGKVLLAKLKQVVPEFADMVRQGLFKKRSISLYPDLTLRHVGFLGAMPPAVKGLSDIAFKEGEESIAYEFDEWKDRTIGDIFRRLREWLIEKFDQDTADRIVPDWSIEDIKTPPPQEVEQPSMYKEATTMSIKEKIKSIFAKAIDDLPDDLGDKPGVGAGAQNYSEADIEKIKKEAEEAGKKKAALEFAEKEKTARKEARGKEIKEYCEAFIKDGKVIPAWIKMGLREFMESLDGEEVIEFAENHKESRIEWFKKFLGELPKVINFKEVATRDQDTGDGDDKEKREKAVSDYMEKNKGTSYKEAVLAVAKENPDLFKDR